VAVEEHLKVIRQGVAAWNNWREKNRVELHDLYEPDLSDPNLNKADLSGANLRGTNLFGADFHKVDLNGADISNAVLSRAQLVGADLSDAVLSRSYLDKANLDGANLNKADLVGAILRGADLAGANLSGADLSGASLYETDLRGADLSRAILRAAQLIETDLRDATLTGSSVYGVSAWNTKVNDRTRQENLIITAYGEPVITVDNIKIAQFIYLLLNNQEIRDVIDTITSKAVLILGRFTPERKEVLDALRDALRTRDYLPLLFDFDRPTDRDFTETIMTLSGMSAFVIADITNPKSSPLELHAAVPDYRIPFVPIIEDGEKPFSMFQDLIGAFHWVLPLLRYDSCENLLATLDDAVIAPALEKRRELALIKAHAMPTRHVRDYISPG
jgi:Pentapeptide repeats (8 copies)